MRHKHLAREQYKAEHSYLYRKWACLLCHEEGQEDAPKGKYTVDQEYHREHGFCMGQRCNV